jgi:outer membrane protein assembly factor BamE (lipoprotein component of BamABCDE complex)
MRASRIVLSVVLAAAVLPACSRVKQNMGYVVDESLVVAIQPGVDNKESVGKTLGRPTFTSEFDDREWYYISRNTTQLAFAAPKTKSQSIIRISFDPKGNVAAVDRRGMEQIASINPVNDKTPTLGREKSLLRDLFGNIGAVGAGSGGGPDSSNTGRDGPR